MKKNVYHDDEKNREVVVWKWISVVPWWRIIVEQKRMALEAKEKSAKENRRKNGRRNLSWGSYWPDK
jgi:hypothetical protein